MIYKLFLALGMISVMILGCSARKNTQNLVASHQPVQARYTAEDTVIIFVILKIYSDSSTNSNKIIVKDKIYTSGRVKDHPVRFQNIGNYITCFLYAGSNLLDSMRLEHPLHKQVEFFDANHQMGMKEIHQKEAEFSVRFQLKGKANRIKILETLDRNKTRDVTMIQL
jgi:hypothetical protein